MHKIIKRRKPNHSVYQQALHEGLSPLLAHIIACRVEQFEGGIRHIIAPALRNLDHPRMLNDCANASRRIVQAIAAREPIGILSDYDVDGISAHAIIYTALRQHFGHPDTLIDSFLGHRLKDGYGITQNLTERILEQKRPPRIIISADCGSSDEARIQALTEAGIDVIVTDHHLIPVEGIPKSAYAVINPCRIDSQYPDQDIAGCMVAWLLMCQVRIELMHANHLPANTPNLAELLDFVALGTIADAVSLFSATNRAVVNAGLTLMNRLQRPCWAAFKKMRGSAQKAFSAQEIGFQIGPRINARSRMSEPTAALRYLLATTLGEALHYLTMLDQDNLERKETEKEMLLIAKNQAAGLLETYQLTLAVADRLFHPGIQGIVASRLVDFSGRPSIVFSPDRDPQVFTGSARSLPGINIREALQMIDHEHPGMLLSFGGHDGAAGLRIPKDQLAVFRDGFEQAVATQSDAAPLVPCIFSDGELKPEQLSLRTYHDLSQLEPYGRKFDAPVFDGYFQVKALYTVGADKLHLAMDLSRAYQTHRSIWFNALGENGHLDTPFKVGDVIHCVYRLHINSYKGQPRLELIIDYAEAHP
jgi:single-stranded-DNA-specific exonuclease